MVNSRAAHARAREESRRRCAAMCGGIKNTPAFAEVQISDTAALSAAVR
jgi:hypothetical protein